MLMISKYMLSWNTLIMPLSYQDWNNILLISKHGPQLMIWNWMKTKQKFFTSRLNSEKLLLSTSVKGALDKFNIIPQLFPKKVGIFIPLEVLAWVMTACQVVRSRLTYFWRYINIPSVFYFSKSTSINTQYSSLWDTLKMMLFTKYLIKWKRIGKISWNFRY